MFGTRWIVGLGALLLAGIALAMLVSGSEDPFADSQSEMSRPALDHIDAKSRDAMRDLLRQADNEE